MSLPELFGDRNAWGPKLLAFLRQSHDEDGDLLPGVVDTIRDGLALQVDLTALGTTVSTHSANTANPHSVTKAQVGLGNADNTADADKPVSTAQATALALKADTTALTAGLATKAEQAALDATNTTVGGHTSTLATHTTQIAYTNPGSALAAGEYVVAGTGGVPQKVKDRAFDVTHPRFGAVGDGTTDDTAAIQAAITAALVNGGTVYFPPTANSYKLTSTLTAIKNGGHLNIEAAGNLLWAGGSNDAVIELRGLSRCQFRNVNVYATSKDNLTAWDLVTDATYQSITHLEWYDCHVAFTTCTASNGWVTRTEGGIADHSYHNWFNCAVAGTTGATEGNIGWLDLNPNAFIRNYVGCRAVWCYHQLCNVRRHTNLNGATTNSATTITVFSTASMPSTGTVRLESEDITYTGKTSTTLTGCTRGANGTTAAAHGDWTLMQLRGMGDLDGAASHFLYGCGGEYNHNEFYLGTSGQYAIYGGRWEHGERFFQSGRGGVAPIIMHITDVNLGAFTPLGDTLFGLTGACQLTLENSQISGYAHNTYAFMGYSISTDAHGGGHPGGGYDGTKLTIRNTQIQGAASPLWLLTGNQRLEIENLILVDGSNNPVEYVDTPMTTAITATTTIENWHGIILADATGGAITCNLPTAAGAKGKQFTIKRTSASNNVVVDGNGAQTIDGATTKTITTQYGFLAIVSDGANWSIVASGGTIT